MNKDLDFKIGWFEEHDNEWQNDMLNEYLDERTTYEEMVEYLYNKYH